MKMVSPHNRRRINSKDLIRQGLQNIEKKRSKLESDRRKKPKKRKRGRIVSERKKFEAGPGGPSDPDTKDTYDVILTLMTARAEYAEEDVRSDVALYKSMKVGFCVGSHLRRHPEQFVAAVSHSSFPAGSRAQLKASNSTKAVYFATLFIFNPTTQEKRAKAGKYASAAQHLADLGVKEENFIGELKKYGVEKLNRMAAAERRKAKALASAATPDPDEMTVSLEGMSCEQTPIAPPSTSPEMFEEPRFKAISVLADAAVALRLDGMRVYLINRPNGRITVSVHPDEFNGPD